MTDIKLEGRALIISIDGDIDHHSADDVKTEIDAAYARTSARDIVLDFERVTFMDSSGIGMIMGRYKNARNRGGTLSVANIHGNMLRIFELSGLPKIINTFESVEHAMKSGRV